MRAVTAWHGTAAALRPILTAMAPASATYAKEMDNLSDINQVKKSLPPIAPGTIAILPGATASSAANFLSMVGLRQQATSLTPDQLIDPQQFNAQRYRIAFYLGGERYVKTVREPGDAQAALIRYLAGGGTLIVLASQPYPLFYGDSPNEQNGPPDPFFAKIGVPLNQAFETAPPGLEMRLALNQQIIRSVPSGFLFPPGDPRLRAASRAQVDPADHYSPLISVQDVAGKEYGDAAFYIEFGAGPAKGGKLLYIWSTLLDSSYGNKLMGAALSWQLGQAFARGQGIP